MVLQDAVFRQKKHGGAMVACYKKIITFVSNIIGDGELTTVDMRGRGYAPDRHRANRLVAL